MDARRRYIGRRNFENGNLFLGERYLDAAERNRREAIPHRAEDLIIKLKWDIENDRRLNLRYDSQFRSLVRDMDLLGMKKEALLFTSEYRHLVSNFPLQH